MREITIHVTHEDIRDGQPSVGSECPIARAIKREFPGVIQAAVTYSSLVICGDDDIAGVYAHPMKSFIERFDNGFLVAPVKFIAYSSDDRPWQISI
jgi:hypothetical protein